MSAIGLPNSKNFAVSAYADYRHDVLVFPRRQSPVLRDMEWESRLEPLQSWSSLLVRGAAIALLTILVLPLVF